MNKWERKGYAAALSGKYKESSDAWRACKGKPKQYVSGSSVVPGKHVSGKYVEAHEYFLSGYHNAPQKNPRSIPRNKWISGQVKVGRDGKIQFKTTAIRRSNPEGEGERWTMAKIRAANRDAGYYFFSKGASKFFHSKIYPTVYQGPGGVFFLTSEYQDHPSTKTYRVRQFVPSSANVKTAGEFRDKVAAGVQARMLARG